MKKLYILGEYTPSYKIWSYEARLARCPEELLPLARELSRIHERVIFIIGFYEPRKPVAYIGVDESNPDDGLTWWCRHHLWLK